jgi:hypothetical protein
MMEVGKKRHACVCVTTYTHAHAHTHTHTTSSSHDSLATVLCAGKTHNLEVYQQVKIPYIINMYVHSWKQINCLKTYHHIKCSKCLPSALKQQRLKNTGPTICEEVIAHLPINSKR